MPSPIFRKRDSKVGFEILKGSTYRIIDQAGKVISPDLRRIRGLIEWKEQNGWIDSL